MWCARVWCARPCCDSYPRLLLRTSHIRSLLTAQDERQRLEDVVAATEATVAGASELTEKARLALGLEHVLPGEFKPTGLYEPADASEADTAEYEVQRWQRWHQIQCFAHVWTSLAYCDDAIVRLSDCSISSSFGCGVLDGVLTTVTTARLRPHLGQRLAVGSRSPAD